MDARRDQLGEIAAEAALERTDFLVQAAEQLNRFLRDNAARIDAVGGLTLIDDDPDFLSVAPDLSFRSRSRYLDDETGEWVSETEVIESASGTWVRALAASIDDGRCPAFELFSHRNSTGRSKIEARLRDS